MKLYEIILEPLSGFGSALKGDMLFGQFCWQIANDPDCSDKIGDFIGTYNQSPFIIFSSAFPKIPDSSHYVFKKPDVPAHLFSSEASENCIEKHNAHKDKKGRKWFLIEKKPGTAQFDTIDFKDIHPVSNEELMKKLIPDQTDRRVDFLKHAPTPHNKINRLTGTTGTGEFAPYIMENFYYYPGLELIVFALIDETVIEPDRVQSIMETMGKCGFGRDASVGMGRFKVKNMSPVVFTANNSPNALYTLAPCVPQKDSFDKENSWFTPFTRFGKHGNYLASSGKPFKSPVIMADEGAIFKPQDASVFEKMYFGEAVTGVSKIMDNAVVQGYTPFLPIQFPK